MKTLLVAVNAKYEHEGLAVWYLKAACGRHNIPVKVMQYSINDSPQRVWSSIMQEAPDVIAFSCYIWNRDMMLKLMGDLRKARPDCIMIVGGPEVSYEGSEADFKAAGADFVIKGEGEGQLPLLLEGIKEQGLKGAQAFFLPAMRCQEPMGYISPFVPEYLQRIRDRIAYIESSRGCPYRCTYCLSSESQGLVLYPLDEVKKDIDALVDAGAKVIKFVDRSFNVHEDHSLSIWEYIRKFPREKVTFHFEINPDRLTQAQMASLMTMPEGLVQLEAGIQSVHARTLKEVSRVMDVERAIENLKNLMTKGNLHIHTDLIAGLPYEDLISFKESFNRVYEIGAHHLQLGFLKLLHGTRIRREAAKHGYKYREYAPYEVLENQYLSAENVLLLKDVEDVLDRTYNSGRFEYTLEVLVNTFPTPFDFYEAFALYMKAQDLLHQPISATRLFELLRAFSQGQKGVNSVALDTAMALDYACSMKNTVLPEFLSDSAVQVLDAREVLGPRLEEGWRKEYRKRFMVLYGICPLKKGEESLLKENTIVVDLKRVNAVTGRAEPFYLV